MKSLTELSTGTLEWRKGGAAPMDFELHANGQVVATLTFLNDNLDLARAETAEGTWSFKHTGLLATLVSIREEGDTTNLASFHPHPFRHGKLQFADGAAFDWVSLPPTPVGASAGGAFLDQAGTPLVRLHAHPGANPQVEPGPERGEVELGLTPPARWRHALLAALGWYLLVFEQVKEQQAVTAGIGLQI